MKVWQELTEEEVKLALDECAREPIHIPGAIQPHGVLFAVTPDTFIVTHASDNLETFFGVSATSSLGKPVSAIIGRDTIAAMQAIIVDRDLQPIQTIRAVINGKNYDLVAHHSGDSLIIELEPEIASSVSTRDAMYDDLRNFAIGMRRAETPQILYDHVVASIRNLTGIDRVKLYRFDEDWNGAVIAESRANFMTSYLGMRFPASDIPEQARILYTRSYLRLISDIRYQAVPLLALSGHDQPLDLSLSTLRSVSPVHIQYLQNMNVRASMSVSIIQNGKLWGLIACHHNAQKFISFRVRMVAEIMGHIFSAQLSTFENQSLLLQKEKRELLIERMRAALERNFRLENLLAELNDDLLQTMNADGLLVITSKQSMPFGKVPSESEINALVDWLNHNHQLDTYYTNNAPNVLKDIDGLENLRGGFLSMSLSQQNNNYVIWFRNPLIEDVRWAGKPEKPLTETRGGYRLTPRSSFALWQEQVADTSEMWSDDDLMTSRNVINVLLEGQKVSAEQASIAKTEFLANMSHEIRTPMNAVVGLAHILATSSPLTEKQRNCIQTLQLSADSLLSLINDLLDIAKIEARTIELEHIPFDLTQLMQEVISMMSVRVKEKGLTFDAEAECVQGQQFFGDSNRIRQILLNLCSNAIKFTDKGGIHIKVVAHATDEPDVWKICLLIRDTGIGIPPDKLDSVFHKFVQADNSITRKYGGTGLGLAITKTLVELMKGTIEVESELGKGSTFTVCLFLKKIHDETAHPPMSDTPAPKRDNGLKRGHILLVEDYPANVMVATMFLEHFGYSWDVASNGTAAVDCVRNNDYALILMDVQMHGMNGFEATQKIRELEKQVGKGRHVPIIGMTAHALTGDRERCIAVGMDDYISKPFNPAELEAKLASHMAANLSPSHLHS